jgi:hypothetical protein
MLVKLILGVNFTNVLQKAFASKDSKVQKDTDNLTIFLYFGDLVSISSTFYEQLLRVQIPKA